MEGLPDSFEESAPGPWGDQKRFNVAYREWCDAAFHKTGGKGKGGKKGGGVVVVLPTVVEKTFLFRSQAVWLTYQSSGASAAASVVFPGSLHSP